jgi:phosphomevalonate kinase
VRARAPGKIVLSGAYAVLEGAPAIVSAVSRYALADSERPAEIVTPEVREAFGDDRAPWFDASELRGPEGKLGLGSSAAILVASLAVRELERGTVGDEELAARVLPKALEAHRRAQRGGSGIDVAASARGGTLIARLSNDELVVVDVALPPGLRIEVWSAGHPASTPELLGQVKTLGHRDPTRYREILGELSAAADGAVAALQAADAPAFVRALDRQSLGLARLGEAAGAPIVTPEVAELASSARNEAAAVLPAGAGGGDVAIFAGCAPPSEELARLRKARGQTLLSLDLHARGVHDAANFG